MNLGKQKKLASRALGISSKRIKFNVRTSESLKQVKELISREGVRDLLGEKVIQKESKVGNSRKRANYIASQKKKGRRQGYGSRKGTANARHSRKDKWMTKIRSMRKLLLEFKEQGTISTKIYRDLYLKCKGNFFRNKRHIVLYMEQHKLFDSDLKNKIQKEEIKEVKKSKKEEKINVKPKTKTKAGGNK